jgi:alpha-glucosidase
MIVAPVTTPVDKNSQLAQESVWIPEGEWIERATGKHFTGPKTVERNFSISQIPVYLRAGAIIPMQPPMRYTGEKPVDPLIINILPLEDGQKSSYSLYEDDGNAEAYKRGVCAWTKLETKQVGDDFSIDITPVEGSYPGMPAQRGYEIRLPGDWPPSSVTVGATNLAFTQKEGAPGWRYEGNTLTTVITVPRHSVHERLHISIHRAEGSLAARKQLDGFAGSTTRLRIAYDTLNGQWPFTWSSDTLIDALQTGDRLSYHPEHAREELARFPNIYAQALTDVQDLVNKANIPDDQLAAQLMQHRGADTAKERAQHYKISLGRALSQLEDGKPE